MAEITKYLAKPSSYIMWLLIVVFGIIGVQYYAGYISASTAAIFMDLMKFIGIALSLAVIMSYTGYVSFGHVVFFGIGGFFTAYELSKYSQQILQGANPYTIFLMGMLIGVGLSVLLAATVGAAVLRLRGAFFAIATIGLDYVILYLEMTYKGGAGGGEIYFNVSRPKFLEETYFVFFIAFVITLIVAYIVKVSKFGYGLAAIREDEDAAEVIGVDTVRYKIYAFMIAAGLAAIWGSVYSWRQFNFTPENFSLAISVDMIVMNVIGGLGTFIGPIIGAFIYYIIYRLTNTYLPQLAYIILGIIVVAVVSFLPEGVAGLIRSKFPNLRKYVE